MAENQIIVTTTADQQARQELAAEMAKLKENPLDRTVPGGKYLGVDGKLHDAEGKPLRGEGAKAEAADESEGDPLAGVDMTPAARKRALDADLVAEDFKRQRPSGASGFTADDVDRIAEKKAKG